MSQVTRKVLFSITLDGYFIPMLTLLRGKVVNFIL